MLNTPPGPLVLTPPEVNDQLAFHTYFVLYGPGSLAPYQPFTLEYHSLKSLSSQTVDEHATALSAYFSISYYL